MELYKTKDGSNTLFHEKFDEHYHSIHGALQESMHVFIQNGLRIQKDKNSLSVFEMGFGTGLNALLAYNFAEENQIQLHYYTIEAYPINQSQIDALGYDTLGNQPDTFKKLHAVSWEKDCAISEYFHLHKMEARVENKDLNYLPKMDVIFYDAFAPSAQANLWETPILEKMYELLKTNGHLTTYCAKGQFKRNLKEVGFAIKAVPGPPGKREMTLAFKH